MQQQPSTQAYVGSYHWGFLLLSDEGEEVNQIRVEPGERVRLTAFNLEAEQAVEQLPEAVRTAVPNEESLRERNVEDVPIPTGIDFGTVLEDAHSFYPNHGLAIVPEGHGRGSAGVGMGAGMMGMMGMGMMGAGMMGAGTAGMGRGNPGTPGQGQPDGRGPPGQGQPDGRGPPDQSDPPGPGQGGGFHGGMFGPPALLTADAEEPVEIEGLAVLAGSFSFVCPVYCGYGHPYMFESRALMVTSQ